MMLRQKIKSFGNSLSIIIFLGCLFSNISFSQIKKIHLKDTNTSHGAGAFNLYQTYKAKKGKLTSYYYGFSSNEGDSRFGRGFSFFAEPSTKIPFGSIASSLDNSTIIGRSKDTLYVYDLTLEKIINQFVFEGLRRIMINNDGSMAIIEVKNNVNKVIDTNTGKTLKEISFNIENYCFSANNRYLALNATDLIHVYDFWEGGDPFVYESKVVSKKKRSSREYIWDVDITSDGLMAMSIALNGKVKKTFFKKQEYAVVDVKNGNRVFELKLEDDDKKWYLYSLDPTGQVFYARGKFYDIKTKRELEVVQEGRSRKGKDFSSWKFHPHLQGVYHAENGKGVIGIYSFE